MRATSFVPCGKVRHPPPTERPPAAQNGYVSIEVDPGLAYDTEATTAEAKRLHALDRPTEPLRQDPGHEARPAGDRGHDRQGQIDQRHAHLLARPLRRGREAYIRGLERLVAAGGDPKVVASVASFFVSRVDTEADRRLDEIGGQRRAQGQARGRKREARLPALQGALLGRAVGVPRLEGGNAAALPLGLDFDEESRLLGRHVR